ncbi:hypothetical protein R3P38DRAFT_2543101 [Favolaschia claudopus]|uniref:C2H2-type domain-containing protein n=1 Tax=Favolaschia claudopus TaxID=2862362 RepID=A0AAW0AST7_9AGAR
MRVRGRRAPTEMKHSDADRKFSCKVCAACFKRPEHLKRHSKCLHELQRGEPLSFAFLGCRKRFSRSDNQKCHTRRQSCGGSTVTKVTCVKSNLFRLYHQGPPLP